jgi:hypothetical protein
MLQPLDPLLHHRKLLPHPNRLHLEGFGRMHGRQHRGAFAGFLQLLVEGWHGTQWNGRWATAFGSDAAGTRLELVVWVISGKDIWVPSLHG